MSAYAFSVLGVKTRLEVIEARLDEIQQEIRHLALRLPAGPREVDFEDVYAPAQRNSRREALVSDRPPIPPAPQDLLRNVNDPSERPAPAAWPTGTRVTCATTSSCWRRRSGRPMRS